MIIDFKRNLVSVADSRSPANDQEKVTFVLEMANLGYVVPFEAFQKASKTALKEAIAATKKQVGADKNWTPLYPNFPRQVVEASSVELFLNAFIHYMGAAFDMNLRPSYPVEIREKLDAIPEDLTVLKIQSEEEILESLIGTLENKISLSEEDFTRIKAAMSKIGLEKSVEKLKGFEFQNKENWIQSLKILIDLGAPKASVQRVALATAKTATDLLRSIFMLYSNDNVHIDLTAKDKRVRLENIPRPVRREIMQTIQERFGDNMDDFFAHKKLWKIVDRKLHAAEFSNYKNAFHAFQIVRGNVPYRSFNSRVNSAIENSNVDEAIKLLSSRPGVFARQLDHTMRSFDESNQRRVALAFSSVAEKVSTPVLVSLYNGLANRDNEESVIRTKSGNTANVTNVKAPITDQALNLTFDGILRALKTEFAEKEPMGKVYVSPDLKDIPAPLQQRTVSAGRVLPRGAKIPMDTSETLRFFVHWYNIESNDYWSDRRVDIDMDAIFLDANGKEKGHISYTRLRNEYAVHSGDITDAPRPDGAAEFIDIDCQKAIRKGVRYVAMNLNVYSGSKINEVENYIGFMVRKGNTQQGEIFDPKTVKSAFTATAPSRNVTPVLFDLVEGKLVWLDTSYGQAGSGFAAWHSADTIAKTIQLELDKRQLSMYDLISANAEARGQLVSEDEAETIFNFDTVDIYDSNGFINQFL